MIFCLNLVLGGALVKFWTLLLVACLVEALGFGCEGCGCPDLGPVTTRKSTLAGFRSLYR